MKIYFLSPYPYSQAPSQRFRYEQYLDYLEEIGIVWNHASFLSEKGWQVLYAEGQILKKASAIVAGFVRRFISLPGMRHYDYIFIHREASPIGPPIFEWLIAKVLRKKIIYDFDDAIWIPSISANNKIAAKLKWHQKVGQICKWSYKVSCGNAYLGEYARQFNPNVAYIPTTIDTEHLHNQIKDHTEEPLTIGWTGTHSTLQYLSPLIPVIKELEAKYDFVFRVICNTKPDFQLKSLAYEPWDKSREIEALSQVHIGLMPLTDDPWAKGKCGFKALQYMALGIPAIVSPVGVNTDIVQHNETGYICDNLEEWYSAIETLLSSNEKRTTMGKKGRMKVIDAYSVASTKANFLKLFLS